VNTISVEARQLEKRFGPVTALQGVDLEIPTGTVVALLGPNGAGKTTLLRLLAGLAQPTRGSLRVGSDGQDRRRRRARIGFVGHATLLYPTLTVRENLIFAARLYGVRQPAARAQSLLEQQGLAAIADLPASACSRGMAQRLSIARGLVHEPEIVLLDEPFTGLDRLASERLLHRLRGLRDARRTLILATHDLAHAAQLADAALVLSRGRIVHRAQAPLSVAALEQHYAGTAGGAA
jgi:heme exporter protein A